MIINLIASYLIPFVIGFQILAFISQKFNLKFSHLEAMFVATILGFVTASAVFLVFNFFNINAVLLESLIAIFFLIFQLYYKRYLPTFLKEENFKIFIIILLFLIPSLLLIITEYNINLDEGGWDALAIWRARAKLLVIDPSCFLNPLSTILPHVEYPPLYSAFLARTWSLSLDFSNYKILYAEFFCFLATSYFMLSIIKLKASSLIAVLGCVTLGLCLEWRDNFSFGYVDNWLGLMILISLYYLSKYSIFREKGHLLLSLLFAGIASLLKNEGIVYLIIFFVLMLKFYKTDFTKWNVIVLVIFISLSVAWKYFVLSNNNFYLDNDLLASQNLNYNTFLKIFEISRHRIIWEWCAKFFTNRNILANAALYLILISGGSLGQIFKHGKFYILLLLLQIFVFYVSFLLTPWPPEMHLDSAANRLYVQLFPSLVAIICMFTTLKTEELNTTR